MSRHMLLYRYCENAWRFYRGKYTLLRKCFSLNLARFVSGNGAASIT